MKEILHWERFTFSPRKKKKTEACKKAIKTLNDSQ